MSKEFRPQPTPEAENNKEIWLKELGSKKTRDAVLRFILLLKTGITPEEAEDATQQTMLNATKAIQAGKFDGSTAKLTTWLYAIAKNATLNILRERKTLRYIKTTSLETNPEQPNKKPSSLDEYISAEQAKKLRSYFDKLSPKMRELMELLADGLSLQEISDRLQTNYQTVNNRYWRARQALKELIPREDEKK